MRALVGAASLEAACEYAEHGDPVFLVWHAEGARCGCGADCPSPAKHPIASCTPNGLKDATTDVAMLRRWFEAWPRANLALRTGVSCTVVDVDPEKGGAETMARLEAEHEPLPVTPKILTGGGWHLYFEAVRGLGNSAGRIGPGVDVRGEDGYALVPPSNHVSGSSYRDDLSAPMFETPRAPMPPWLVSLAATVSPTVHGNGHHRLPPDVWAEKLAGAPIGQRRAVALEIAGHYLGLRIEPVEVETILRGYAERCAPPFPEGEVRSLVRDLARRDRAKAQAAETEHAAREPEADGPVIVRLSDIQPEPVTWLWSGRIAAGKLVLVIGEPGDGKTYFLCDVNARLSRGRAWPDGAPGALGDSITLTAEDGLADTLRPRIDRQGGDAARIHILRAIRQAGQERPFTLEHDLVELEAAIRSTRAVLVSIDPLSAYLGSRDSYKDSEIRGLLGPLSALAERTRVAVVGVLHLTKAAQRRILNRAQGSIAFVAAARVALAVGQDPNMPDRRLLVSIKNNVGAAAPALAFRIGDAGLVWEPDPVDGTAETLLAQDEAPARSESRERQLAVEFLRDLLGEGPVPSKQVEADGKANGVSQRTLWRAKSDLGIVAKRGPGQRGTWFWSLPEEGA